MNSRNICRIALSIILAAALFGAGRYSARADVQRIPMSPDQILIGVGMVKAAVDELDKSIDRLVDIGERRANGQLTRTKAKEMIQAERTGHLSRISSAVSAVIGRNAIVSREFTVPAGELSEEMLNLVEYAQTKYPRLFGQFMN